ncbi:MAG: RHS repeat-associated core domain-containing protein [Saprospiraceae bacterium]
MKMTNRSIITAATLLVFTMQMFAQNIPTANWTGPWGVQVNTWNGNFFYDRTDLAIPNQGVSLEFSFFYNAFRDTLDLGFGKGWTNTYSFRYIQASADTVVVERPDGRGDAYRFTGGMYKSPKGIFDKLEAYQPGKMRLTTKSGMQYFFDDASHKRLTKIEDTNGNSIALTYSNGDLVSVTDPSGRVVTLQWTNGHLATITDNNTTPGRTISYSYNNGFLQQVTDPLGNTMQYSYDNRQLTRIVNERGEELLVKYTPEAVVEEVSTCLSLAKFHYNPAQFKTYVVEQNIAGDQLTTYAYDASGRLISKTGACCGYNTAYQYDSDNNLGALTDANGNQLLATHDGLGNTLATTDPLSGQQSFGYEPVFNRLNSIKDKNGNQTQMQYDPKGNLTMLQMPEGVSVAMGYTSNGNLASMTDAKLQTTNFSYNANNELEFISYPIGVEQFQYDGVGNMTKSTDANGNSVHFEYDLLNRLKEVVDPLNNTVQFEYDATSNLSREVDANTNEKSYEYDQHNRLAAVTTPAGTTRYDYDASDNLIAITDANGHVTRFRYDARNLLVEETDPLGLKTSYSHDGNGNVMTRTDPNGNTTEYTYDALNRLIRKSYLGNTDNFVYDLNGNLIQSSNNHVSIRFTYDDLNRLTSKSIDNWGKTIQYSYDLNGNRASMIDPDGGTTLYEYDGNDRLTKITNPAGQATEFIYDLGGRITEQRNHNGSVARYMYDASNRLWSLENQRSNNTSIANFAFTYDANGNRLTEIANPGVSTLYSYDGENRLTGLTTPTLSEQYSFDSTGNRLTLVRNSVTTNYAYDEGDRLQTAGPATFKYDPNGNQTQRDDGSQKAKYEYDGENRLVRVVTSTGNEVRFQYDPFGNRISQTVNGVETRYFLDGDNVLLELNASGTTQARYTSALALDSWLIMQRSGQSYYYHTNALGSVVALTDGSQNTVQTYQYDTYGNLSASTGSVVNPYRYTGRAFDVATELYYYRTRYYDAREGRFLSRDGFPLNLISPSENNRYSYAGANPILIRDQTGEFWSVAIGVGAMVYNFYKQYKKYSGRIECIDYFDVISTGATIMLGFSAGKNIVKVLKGYALKNPKVREFVTTPDIFLNYISKKLKNFILDKSVNGKYAGPALESAIEALANKNLIDGFMKGLAGLGIKFSASQIDLNLSNCEPSLGDQEITDEIIDDIKDLPDIVIDIIRSMDPNEIIAPPGVGAAKWVAASATLPYTILFENDPDFATASAQRVLVEHVLDEDLNPYSFRLGDFGFGNWYFEVPQNLSYYSTRIDLADTLGVWLDVLAGIDVQQRRAFWIFESVDPATGLAASLPAESGFLPVNDTLLHSGEGFVNFTVRPRVSAITGSTIDAQAVIVFDNNPPIGTNLAFNTVDADAPISGITMIDTVANGIYDLLWNGNDIGSGLESYTLYVSTNYGPFLPSIGSLSGTGYTFEGKADTVYAFFTIARDSVGNTELLKYTGEPSCMSVTVTNIVSSPMSGMSGSATLVVNGNTGNLQYTWSHDPSLNSPVANGLAPGVYTVLVEDQGGCTVAVSFTVKTLLGTSSANTGTVIHRIYPVPTSGQVTVEFSTPVSTAYIQVFDASGKMVIQQNAAAAGQDRMSVVVDLSTQKPGNYLISILTPDDVVSGVVIKQ